MIDFIGKKNIYFIISGIIILAGLISFVMFGGLNLDLDFRGGTAIRMAIGQDFSNDEINEIVKSVTGNTSIIQKTGDNNTEVYIKTLEIGTDKRDQIVEQIKSKYGLEQSALLEANNVSASASTKLIKDALSSIFYSIIFMLIYIWFRFDLRSGFAAVLALMHDVLIMFSVYSIFQIPFNSSFIAAILTIVGYSINDTIIVFDRIRENVKVDRKSRFADVTNRSINQTLTRTINTSLTTLFTITTLYVLGVASIREFALPIIIGISVGTFSSICIASPLWNIFKDINFGSKKRLRKA